MKISKLTLALAAAGVIGGVAQAEEQHALQTALSSTTLSGYVDTSAIYHVGNDRTFGGGRVFDGPAKWDGFNLNVVKLSLEKPLDEGQWSAGYKVDLLFGPDANFYGSNTTFGGPSTDDVAVKQAYAVARIPAGNGIDVKMGVFDTVIGYEVFESPNNPNYSRSYGFGIEPTHHTGLLASYHVNDMVSVSGGMANTYSGNINSRSRANVPFGTTNSEELAYLGSVTLTLPEGAGALAGSAIYAGIVDGVASGTGSNNDATSYYVGTTLATPMEGLNLGAAFDYRDDGNFASPTGDGWAWAAAAYASFQASEPLRLNVRADYLKGSNGTVYGVAAGEDNELFGVTATADYALWSSLLTRLEARWDHAMERPVFVGSDRNVLTLALNVVYKF